jgi:hypothetical protein
MVRQRYNPSTLEAEEGRSGVQGNPVLQIKTLSQQNQNQANTPPPPKKQKISKKQTRQQQNKSKENLLGQ